MAPFGFHSRSRAKLAPTPLSGAEALRQFCAWAPLGLPNLRLLFLDEEDTHAGARRESEG